MNKRPHARDDVVQALHEQYDPKGRYPPAATNSHDTADDSTRVQGCLPTSRETACLLSVLDSPSSSGVTGGQAALLANRLPSKESQEGCVELLGPVHHRDVTCPLQDEESRVSNFSPQDTPERSRDQCIAFAPYQEGGRANRLQVLSYVLRQQLARRPPQSERPGRDSVSCENR